MLITRADEHGRLDAGRDIQRVDVQIAAPIILIRHQTTAQRRVLLSRGLGCQLQQRACPVSNSQT